MNAHSNADEETSLERAFEDSGMNEQGEIVENTAIVPQPPFEAEAAPQAIIPQAKTAPNHNAQRTNTNVARE